MHVVARNGRMQCYHVLNNADADSLLGKGMNERTMLLPGVDAFGDLSGSFQRTSRLSSATLAAGIPPLHIPSKCLSSQSIGVFQPKRTSTNDDYDYATGLLFVSFFALHVSVSVYVFVLVSVYVLKSQVSSSQSQSPFTSKHWKRYIRSTFYKYW